MFRFVVTHLRWMAWIPLAPQIFDAWLTSWTALTDRQRLQAMEEFEEQTLRLTGVRSVPHRLGGIGFAIGQDEFAHMHGNGLIDARLTSEIAGEFIAEGLAEPHHVLGKSTWVSFWLRSRADLPRSKRIVARAHALACSKQK
jgi:hypothetical protein